MLYEVITRLVLFWVKRISAVRYLDSAPSAVCVSSASFVNNGKALFVSFNCRYDLANLKFARITSYNVCYTKLLRFICQGGEG